MSKADELYRATCLDILEHGVWDTGQQGAPPLGRRGAGPHREEIWRSKPV